MKGNSKNSPMVGRLATHTTLRIPSTMGSLWEGCPGCIRWCQAATNQKLYSHKKKNTSALKIGIVGPMLTWRRAAWSVNEEQACLENAYYFIGEMRPFIGRGDVGMPQGVPMGGVARHGVNTLCGVGRQLARRIFCCIVNSSWHRYPCGYERPSVHERPCSRNLTISFSDRPVGPSLSITTTSPGVPDLGCHWKRPRHTAAHNPPLKMSMCASKCMPA